MTRRMGVCLALNASGAAHSCTLHTHNPGSFLRANSASPTHPGRGLGHHPVRLIGVRPRGTALRRLLPGHSYRSGGGISSCSGCCGCAVMHAAGCASLQAAGLGEAGGSGREQASHGRPAGGLHTQPSPCGPCAGAYLHAHRVQFQARLCASVCMHAHAVDVLERVGHKLEGGMRTDEPLHHFK